MKKILICSLNDNIGGAEQILKMIAYYYLKQGAYVDVFFLTLSKGSLWQDLIGYNNLKLYYTKSKKESKGIFPFCKNIIKRNILYDYAFTSHVHCTALVGILRKLRLLNIRYFIARESTSIFKRFRGLKLGVFKLQYQLGYSPVDLLICQTDYMKNQLVEALPWLEKKVNIKTIPNPIDLNNIWTKAIESLNIEVVEPYVVSAGRLILEKGFDILIKAFERLIVNYPELKLVILGEGNQQEKLEEQIKKSDLQKKVYLLGFRPNVYPYLKEAQLCVVSSRIEGFPNILLQMMSQNTKVVSTLCAGGIDAIEGIYTCGTEDVDALYESINKCLAEDTGKNRSLFDRELKKRSITEFLNTINRYVQ